MQYREQQSIRQVTAIGQDQTIMTRNPAVEPPKVGNTLAELRQLRALSLDELSRLAGVSKSMLSQIERNQANPTVTVV